MLDSLLKKRRLPALDGVRAVSVLIVIIYHFGLQSVPGDLGVAAFFVLSGFLITWLLLKEEGETGRISLRNFYRRRVLRIFPAFYVFFFASFCVDYVRGQHWNGTMFLSGMFYFMNYYNASHGHPASAIAHAWSLAIEEQFYLMWPLLFLVTKNRKALLIAAICAVATWRTLLYAFWGAPPAYVYNAFDTRFDNLAVGCLLAVLLQDERVIKAASVRRWWVPLVPMSLLIISRSFTPSIYHYTIGYTVDAVLIAVWIVQVMQLQVSGLWSWLEHPVTRYIGAISYPMYLYHIWAIGLAERSPVMKLPLAITFTIIAASMSYHFIEKPFLKLKGRPAIRSEAAP
jgi:peptidoglycan/LPS O-acetylase OafA/YrhL